MKLTEKNGVYLITADSHETFWAYQAIDPVRAPLNRPKIKDVLRDWWDTTAPGSWTTSYLEKFEKVIVVGDKRLFGLFKLAWTGTPEIHRPESIDVAFCYCPYIPLIQTNVFAANDSI